MIDVDLLLAPISEDKPCGDYLKLDRSVYRALRNTYNAAQSSFRQLVETPDASSDLALVESNQSNWDQLRDTTYGALTSSTKDLELLGWFITSQAFTPNAYANLASASQVLVAYIDNFWSTLNPMPPAEKLKASDDAGREKEWAEFRIKPLLQLVGESQDSTSLYVPFQMISLIDDVTYGDFLKAERNGTLGELKDKASSLFSTQVEADLLSLSQAHGHFQSAETMIAQKCGNVGATPISFKFIKSNIEDLIKALQFLVGDKFDSWPLGPDYRVIETQNDTATQVESTVVEPQSATDTAPQTGVEAPAAQTGSPQVPTMATTQPSSVSVTSSQVTNRDQAFQELRRLAEYFKQTEPHSPVSFLLERAIRWGYLSLPELLQEMIGSEQQVLNHINHLTGMDNLNQAELPAGVQAVTTPPVTPVSSPISAEPTSQVDSNENRQSVTQNTQTTTDTQTSQSSGGLTDFEW